MALKTTSRCARTLFRDVQEKVGTGWRKLGCGAPGACLSVWVCVWLNGLSYDGIDSLERGSVLPSPVFKVADAV